MAKICPTCGQPVPETPAGETPGAPTASPGTPASGASAPPPKRFPLVPVAIACAAALVVLGGGYLIFGGKGPLAERLFSERQEVRDRALEELANLETADRAPVIEALVVNLTGPDARKKACSIDALSRLKLPAEDARPVLPGLLALMREPDTAVAMQALAAANRVAPRPADVQAASLEVIRAQAARFSATAYLAVLAGIGQSLSSTGEAVQGLPTVLGSLVLSTPDAGVRMTVLGLVARLSATAQAEAGAIVTAGAFSSTAILQALDDPNASSRQALLGSIMRLVPDPGAVAPQLVPLTRNPSPVLRIMAGEVLMSASRLTTPSWNAVTGLLKDTVVDVRRAAVAAVKPRGKGLPKMAVTALIALLKDPDEGVRSDAAAALEPLPTPRVRTALAAYAKAKAPAEPVSPEPALDEYFSAAASSTSLAGSAAASAPAEPATAAAGSSEPATAPAAASEPAAAPAAPPEPAAAAATPPAPAEPAATTAAPSAAGSDGPAPDDAKTCPKTADQATAIAKDHLPRAVRDGPCKEAVEYSVKRSAQYPCVFDVTVSCQGQAVATCAVNGATEDYVWSQ